MEYNKLISVSGLPGLYEMVSSKNDGALVKSLDDKTTKFVSSRIHRISHLESIEIYTVRENVNLADVFNAMAGSPEAVPDEKDSAGIKKYFEKVYPDMDFERVYASDMKKIVKWFDVLKKNNIEIKLSEPEEDETAEEVPEPDKTAQVIEEKEKPAAKKSAKKKEATTETPQEEKPKKAAKKKKE